jgi:hypothetical protein
MIGFPKVDTGLAHTDLFGNFCDRQTTLYASVTQQAR